MAENHKFTNSSGDDPVFACDEDGTSNGHVSDLERLDELLILVVPQMQSAIVEGYHHPWLSRVDIATLDTVTACLVHFLIHNLIIFTYTFNLCTHELNIGTSKSNTTYPKTKREFLLSYFCADNSTKSHF